jgi:hypothetical protein
VRYRRFLLQRPVRSFQPRAPLTVGVARAPKAMIQLERISNMLASQRLSEDRLPALSHAVPSRSISEDFHCLNILANHILAPLFEISRKGKGKNMAGKNISIVRPESRQNDLANKAIRISEEPLRAEKSDPHCAHR